MVPEHNGWRERNGHHLSRAGRRPRSVSRAVRGPVRTGLWLGFIHALAGNSAALADQEGRGSWPWLAPVRRGVALARAAGADLGAGEVGHHDQWSWSRPYLAYASLIRLGRGLAAVAEAHRAAWAGIVEAQPDGKAALIVSHGGAIEPALVACLPHADHASWGRLSATAMVPA